MRQRDLQQLLRQVTRMVKAGARVKKTTVRAAVRLDPSHQVAGPPTTYILVAVGPETDAEIGFERQLLGGSW